MKGLYFETCEIQWELLQAEPLSPRVPLLQRAKRKTQRSLWSKDSKTNKYIKVDTIKIKTKTNGMKTKKSKKLLF